MELQGLHHITMISGDAQRNVDFYADVLGLRLVKKTVNFDAPEAYHLYFGDEQGSPGTLLTWFEFPGAAAGRPGAGMVHRIELGVGSEAALSFWEERLRAQGHRAERRDEALRLHDPDGLALELSVTADEAPAHPAAHPQVPAELSIIRPTGARAYGAEDRGSETLLIETLGFVPSDDGFLVQGGRRPFRWSYDPPPAERGLQGSGTVHHIAWASKDADHAAWRERAAAAGAHVTPVIDRDYFLSIYFREPSGVLFEIATLSPGFAVDEDIAHLGERLSLPAQHEHLRDRLEQLLTPVVNPRTAGTSSSTD